MNSTSIRFTQGPAMIGRDLSVKENLRKQTRASDQVHQSKSDSAQLDVVTSSEQANATDSESKATESLGTRLLTGLGYGCVGGLATAMLAPFGAIPGFGALISSGLGFDSANELNPASNILHRASAVLNVAGAVGLYTGFSPVATYSALAAAGVAFAGGYLLGHTGFGNPSTRRGISG